MKKVKRADGTQEFKAIDILYSQLLYYLFVGKMTNNTKCCACRFHHFFSYQVFWK